jgi:NADPH:quinone reductase-like Zn-dependent oxidoreductase
MKAFLLERYGPPEVLQLAEVERPAPAAAQVLVKVLGVSVNPADWRSMRAKALLFARDFGVAAAKTSDPRRRRCRASGGVGQRRQPVQGGR